MDDVSAGRLNIDQLQKKQAEKELQTSEDVLPRVARECYKWLLCPVQNSPTETKSSVETFPLNTSGAAFGSEIERVCVDNELVITTWSPIHHSSDTNPASPVPSGALRAKAFHGMADIPAATAKLHLVQLAEEIISVLASDPNAQVKVTVEMSAEFSNGATD